MCNGALWKTNDKNKRKCIPRNAVCVLTCNMYSCHYLYLVRGSSCCDCSDRFSAARKKTQTSQLITATTRWVFTLEVGVTLAYIREKSIPKEHHSHVQSLRAILKWERRDLALSLSVDVGSRCWEGSLWPHGKTLLTSKCVPSPQIECFHMNGLGSSYSKELEIATTELRAERRPSRSLRFIL